MNYRGPLLSLLGDLPTAKPGRSNSMTNIEAAVNADSILIRSILPFHLIKSPTAIEQYLSASKARRAKHISQRPSNGISPSRHGYRRMEVLHFQLVIYQSRTHIAYLPITILLPETAFSPPISISVPVDFPPSPLNVTPRVATRDVSLNARKVLITHSNSFVDTT